MAIMKGTPEQVQQMARVRAEVEAIAEGFRETTEVAIIVGALAQVARTLLRRYPQKVEAQLLAGLVAFFRNAEPEAEREGSPIILPRRRVH